MQRLSLLVMATLGTATVAFAEVTMQLSLERTMPPGGDGITVALPTASYTFDLYVNFQVGPGTPAGIRSVEGRIGATAPDVVAINSADWTSAKNTNMSEYPQLASKYDMEGPFGSYTWMIVSWLPMPLVDGPINSPSPYWGMPFATERRIGGCPCDSSYRPTCPGGVFLPTDGVLTLAILEVQLLDLAPGEYHLNFCDASYTDKETGADMPITPGEDFVITVPEPAAALLLIGALPFLYRRRL